MAVQDEDGSRLIDCREAARRYGCTMRYIRRLAFEGRIPHQVIGGSYLFSASEIDRIRKDAAHSEGRHKKRSAGFRPG